MKLNTITKSLRKASAARAFGKRSSVFLIHGRDIPVNQLVRSLLEKLDIHVIGWEKAVSLTGSAAPFVLDIVTAGMKAADAAVVLFTPDEDVSLVSELRETQESGCEGRQSRPNVWIEAGMALALDRDAVVLIEYGNCRSASDLSGLHFLRFDTSQVDRFLGILANRLRAAGCHCH
jgi:predicted nucleotide-binding protein